MSAALIFVVVVVFANGGLVCTKAKTESQARQLALEAVPVSLAPGPPRFSASHVCLALFLLTEVSVPLSSACCQAACPVPPPNGVVPSYLAATLGPWSSRAPWEQQSMGRNSLPDRWTHGGWAASAGLPRKPETGAEHHGCFLNRNGRAQS